jgi:hypothetical protein
MMNLITFLLAAVGPLAVRVIAAVGMSVLTFTGVDTALNEVISTAQSSWGGMSAAVLGLAGVAGIPACLGLIAGAMSARVGMWVAASAAKWIVK